MSVHAVQWILRHENESTRGKMSERVRCKAQDSVGQTTNSLMDELPQTRTFRPNSCCNLAHRILGFTQKGA